MQQNHLQAETYRVSEALELKMPQLRSMLPAQPGETSSSLETLTAVRATLQFICAKISRDVQLAAAFILH